MLAFAALAAPTDESEGAVAAIPVNDFEPRVTAIAEHKERPALQILVELACDHAREPVKSFAHIAGLQCHEYP